MLTPGAPDSPPGAHAPAVIDPATFARVAEELAEWGRWLYARGWSPATSSNYSVRLDADHCAITTSGRDKETLTPGQIMAVDLRGRPVGGGKPSAETLLHTRIYQRFPDAGAVLHTHSIPASVISRSIGPGETLILDGWELCKAFPGITDHYTPLHVPILPNSQDMGHLADLADRAMAADPSARAYLIAGHGTYTWGPDLDTTRRQIEALEFLFECELQLRHYGERRPRMSRLAVYRDDDPARALLRTEDWARIQDELRRVGVRFERWIATGTLRAGARREHIEQAYQADIARLMGEGGYRSWDVISVAPADPDAQEQRRKFLAEHTHVEDEVRLFTAGAGLFSLHLEGRVYQVLCTAGDLIGIPDGTRHWFDAGPAPSFAALRFFGTPDGWVGHFTASDIAAGFPAHES